MKRTLLAGWGYYDITTTPYGGDFHRATEDMPIEIVEGKKGQHPDEVVARTEAGRTIVVKSGALAPEATTISMHYPFDDGPYRVEPLQWDHGASIAICSTGPDARILATIAPENAEDEPDESTAKRAPNDEANAQLFAASWSLYRACEIAVNSPNIDELARNALINAMSKAADR